MNRIKDLREDLDLRQSDVAKATGLDQRTLSNYETGKTNPDSYAIIKLAEFFNVSTDYLLGVKSNRVSNVEKIEKKVGEMQNQLDEISDLLKKLR